MVYRVFVEKKEGLANEAKGLLGEARNLLGITALEDIRLFNRYDAENISEELFARAKTTVFSEPPVDFCTEEMELDDAAAVFAVAALPEKGRDKSNGNSSLGTPSIEKMGDSQPLTARTAPEALSIPTATSSAVSVGSSRTAVSSPSRAPRTKVSKLLRLPPSISSPTTPINAGNRYAVADCSRVNAALKARPSLSVPAPRR